MGVANSRNLIAGWAMVLFTSKDKMVAGLRERVPDTIGQLYVGYDINESRNSKSRLCGIRSKKIVRLLGCVITHPQSTLLANWLTRWPTSRSLYPGQSIHK